MESGGEGGAFLEGISKLVSLVGTVDVVAFDLDEQLEIIQINLLKIYL